MSEEFRPGGELPPDELPSDERLTAPRLFLFVVAGLLAWGGLYYLILHLA